MVSCSTSPEPTQQEMRQQQQSCEMKDYSGQEGQDYAKYNDASATALTVRPLPLYSRYAHSHCTHGMPNPTALTIRPLTVLPLIPIFGI